MVRKTYLGGLFLCFSLNLCFSQVIIWGPTAPAVYSDNLTEGDLSDLNRLVFNIGAFDKMTNVPLPVDLGGFRLNEEGCNIHLEWVTLSETNNHYFDLERSSEGINFQVIKRVLGEGTTVETNTYYHLDPIKEKDKELYYRLKQVDYDGGFKYSQILSVRPEDCGSEIGDFLSVYPNPVEKGVEVNVVYENDSNDSKANVRVISMQGVVVKNFVLQDLDKGINNFSVDLTQLPGGNYIMELEKSDGRYARVKLSVIKL